MRARSNKLTAFLAATLVLAAGVFCACPRANARAGGRDVAQVVERGGGAHACCKGTTPDAGAEPRRQPAEAPPSHHDSGCPHCNGAAFVPVAGGAPAVDLSPAVACFAVAMVPVDGPLVGTAAPTARAIVTTILSPPCQPTLLRLHCALTT